MDKILSIVNKILDKLMTIGIRLKEERMRLMLSQENFAALAGVHRKSQANYEMDKNNPVS